MCPYRLLLFVFSHIQEAVLLLSNVHCLSEMGIVYMGFQHSSADMLVWFYPSQNSLTLLPISQVHVSSMSLLLNVGKVKNMVMGEEATLP